MKMAGRGFVYRTKEVELRKNCRTSVAARQFQVGGNFRFDAVRKQCARDIVLAIRQV
jgi:hypothetical protein